MVSAPLAKERPAPRLLTSLRSQAIEYRGRWLVLLFVLALPLAFWSSTYYTTPDRAVEITVPTRAGSKVVTVPERETWPLGTVNMGVAWGVAAAAFFAVAGNLQRDRRLVMGGYRAWQILLARLGILAAIAVILATVASLIFNVITTSLHPELTWLAAFQIGLISAGVGLLIGTLLPRPTEGMLLIIGIFGVGMSLGEEAARYFFTYPAQQLFLTGASPRSLKCCPTSWQPWPSPGCRPRWHWWSGRGACARSGSI